MEIIKRSLDKKILTTKNKQFPCLLPSLLPSVKPINNTTHNISF